MASLDVHTTAVIIHPGDRVLIALRDNVTREQAHILKGQMNTRYPDVEFNVISGVQAIAVIPAQTTP